MTRRLPPLNALRAFEAAARHLSFTKAAKELNVTQAAISHQVKLLEETLGLSLFRRLNRRLLLTDAGQAYLPPLRDAFDAMAAATERLQTADDSGPLKISTLNSFAVKWLLPRLPRFQARHPEVDVTVSSSGSLVDFARDDVDLGIRYGQGRYPGLRVDRLMEDLIIPVCCPSLLEGEPPLRSPEDLRHHTLLHDDVHNTPDDPAWAIWLEMNRIDGVDPKRGLRFSEANMVIQAAIAGQGVALSRRVIAMDDIEAGLLVIPFGPAQPTRWVYSLVGLPDEAERPKVRLFRDWLLEEAAKTRAAIDADRKSGLTLGGSAAAAGQRPGSGASGAALPSSSSCDA